MSKGFLDASLRAIAQEAGTSTGFSSTGRSGIIRTTPTTMTRVVTMALVATLRVEMISFSGVPTFVFAISLALMAQGIFMFVTFPVIKAR